MQIVINFLLAIYVLVTLLMILVILMQRPKSEGLGAAFGRRDRKYFRRTDDERPGQVHCLVGGNFLCPDFRIVDLVFAQDESRHRTAARAPQAANERATVCLSSARKSKRAGSSRSGRASNSRGERCTESFDDGNSADRSVSFAETQIGTSGRSRLSRRHSERILPRTVTQMSHSRHLFVTIFS